MLGAFSQKLAQSGQTAGVIISVALMLFLGFAMTRITKALRLPDVTAYILTGIFIGPYCLNLIPANVIDGMDFISDIALAFIAFSVGEFFKLSTLKKSGLGVIVITLLEACMASVFVFVLTYFALGLDLAFCAVARGARFGDGSRVHSHDHSADRCEGRFCRDAAANCGVRRRGEPCCLQHCHFYRAGRERKPGIKL